MVEHIDFAELRRRMVENLVREGIIRSDEVKRAMLTVPREEFVWPDCKDKAYWDTPLPLGTTGQTISAPHMVAIMLEECELGRGMRVLEIGAGSGYNAALMAEIVNPKGSRGSGKVITVDRVKELVEFAKMNLKRTGYDDRVEVYLADGSLGYPEGCEEELYDRIMVTASSPKVPKMLKKQLKKGGILLIPVGDLWAQSLLKLMKREDGSFDEKHVCECIFVPLIGANGYPEY
ncbi:MAG: protein-L-isoaspartate(D-aspartate) O-methyltransferase [Nitrososphaerota archaeon]|nr:protein-L-isoaspartate(D-aspartate) O-methyltransferase [Nitrososphaerales archaeon]MCX8191473.1 protein-L-isoaspartate(D-aspartate) O-methyltransferase [Nitrososphaerales archaeon]MDW8045493.1 protein-L-isoaspartate(D-aspartate) O-methyltransferase [Nitrososphaerota archaeon]